MTALYHALASVAYIALVAPFIVGAARILGLL